MPNRRRGKGRTWPWFLSSDLWASLELERMLLILFWCVVDCYVLFIIVYYVRLTPYLGFLRVDIRTTRFNRIVICYVVLFWHTYVAWERSTSWCDNVREVRSITFFISCVLSKRGLDDTLVPLLISNEKNNVIWFQLRFIVKILSNYNKQLKNLSWLFRPNSEHKLIYLYSP